MLNGDCWFQEESRILVCITRWTATVPHKLHTGLNAYRVWHLHRYAFSNYWNNKPSSVTKFKENIKLDAQKVKWRYISLSAWADCVTETPIFLGLTRSPDDGLVSGVGLSVFLILCVALNVLTVVFFNNFVILSMLFPVHVNVDHFCSWVCECLLRVFFFIL